MIRAARRLLSAALVACFGVGACSSQNTELDSGLWHFNAGLYGEAIPRLLSAVPSVERDNPADPRLPTAYVALGDMAAADREYKRAEDFYKKAVLSAKTRHTDNNALNRNSLVHMGVYLLDQKRPAEALPFLADASAISARDETIPRLLYAIDLDNLNLAYIGLQDYVRGDEASRQALNIISGLDQTRDVLAAKGVVLYNAAYGLAERGQDKEAEAYYRESLSEVSANGEQWRKNTVLSNYAILLRRLGRDDEAHALEEQVKR